ncbi:MAG: putative dolichyl pyrophosphate Man9 c2 alpha-1 [Trebouxia sp. A1-2]|nr:MAG: putative dolichyl pyrophosphate Man9 c2 alpha-1 [Trebouxia sp. A1-2]
MPVIDKQSAAISCIVLCGAALLARFTVGLHPYSGRGVAPHFGDYEAQRHWMEVTVHLPASEWYVDSKSNNLSYWGLDYPPLSGYQSWLFGQAIRSIEPDAVALHTSHGYESPHSKFLMRLTVVVSDILVFFPAVLLCLRVFGGGKTVHEKQWWLLVVLLQPAALLIDHGHFQYNNITLGFAAGAAAAIAAGHDCWGSMLFCLSLNHKQMSMYYAPAFFAHLLGKCLQKPSMTQQVFGVAKLGLVVVATFAVCWAPFLASPGGALQVLHRLVPVKRGLYEDYVANFWCVTSPVFKWRRVYTQQVHEKSILLALLPVTLLAFDQPVVAAWLPVWAALSMYPLLRKDGLSIAYLACLLLWLAVVAPRSSLQSEQQSPVQTGHAYTQSKRSRRLGPRVGAKLVGVSGPQLLHYASLLSLLPAACIHVAQCFVQPPAQLLHLYDAAFVTLSFVHIFSTAVYFNVSQWSLFMSLVSKKHSKRS